MLQICVLFPVFSWFFIEISSCYWHRFIIKNRKRQFKFILRMMSMNENKWKYILQEVFKKTSCNNIDTIQHVFSCNTVLLFLYKTPLILLLIWETSPVWYLSHISYTFYQSNNWSVMTNVHWYGCLKLGDIKMRWFSSRKNKRPRNTLFYIYRESFVCSKQENIV